MDSNKHSNKARKPTLTPQETKETGKTSAKSITSTKTTHGSLSSGSASNGNHGASSGNTQREASILQKWLEQTPRDEPWRPGSRKA